VKAKVRDDIVKKKALDEARKRASEIAPKLKSGDFSAVAKAAGLAAHDSELLARGSAVPEAGVSPAVDAVAFTLPTGGVRDAIVTEYSAATVTETAPATVKVWEKKDVTPAEVTTGKPQVREQLIAERRNRFYTS